MRSTSSRKAGATLYVEFKRLGGSRCARRVATVVHAVGEGGTVELLALFCITWISQ